MGRWVLLGLVLPVVGLTGAYANLFDGLAEARIERPAPQARRESPRRVLLVSIDGLAPRVLAATPTPNLDRLAREGRAARLAETVVPSSTLPAHTSMISGLRPKGHRVRWNRYEPWRRYEVRTLFSICAEQRLRCGLFAGKAKIAHMAEDEPGIERWQLAGSAEDVFAAAADYLAERDPHFVLVHVGEVDLVGHGKGWDSPAQRAAVAHIDGLLGPFVNVAATTGSGRLALIVTSDHGGHGKRHGSDRPEDLAIPWILWGGGIPPGPIAEPISTIDTAPTVLALLGLPVPSYWRGTPRYPAAH